MNTKVKARQLRQRATNVEQKLWARLRNKQQGFKFRRQEPIGSYIVDFVCYEKKVIIELDGSQHAVQTEYDKLRTAFLQQEGFEVLRFWNNDVNENIEGVMETLLHFLSSSPHASTTNE